MTSAATRSLARFLLFAFVLIVHGHDLNQPVQPVASLVEDPILVPPELTCEQEIPGLDRQVLDLVPAQRTCYALAGSVGDC